MTKPRPAPTRLNRDVPHLFSKWPRIAARLRRAKRILLFLDFDGTLVGFKSRPQDVKLPAAARALLVRLARHPKLRLWLISGRRRPDLMRRARVPGANYIGLHGWERRARQALQRPSRQSLDRARKEIDAAIDRLPGVWIEDKKFTFSVHYRLARSDAARKARRAISRLIEAQPNGLYLLKGNKVVGVLPDEIEGKGAAVLEMMGETPKGMLAVYAGDDTTDETAFEALAGRGITILVGPPKETHAHYRLRDPNELLSFLHRLQRSVT